MKKLKPYKSIDGLYYIGRQKIQHHFNYKCKGCGIEINFTCKNIRSLKKTISEHLITTKLFGCSECINHLKGVKNAIQ